MFGFGVVVGEFEGADVGRAKDSHHQLREAQSSHTNQDRIEHIPRLPTCARSDARRVSTVFVVLFKLLVFWFWSSVLLHCFRSREHYRVRIFRLTQCWNKLILSHVECPQYLPSLSPHYHWSQKTTSRTYETPHALQVLSCTTEQDQHRSPASLTLYPHTIHMSNV